MKDIIYRADAIEAVRFDTFNTLNADERELEINRIPSAVTKDWIPCSERLPSENGDYIVALEDAVYPWATFHNGKWFMLSVDNTAREFGAYEVIAWMPLPKPYKGGDIE